MVGTRPAHAADARPRIDQERWLEWQVADAISAARQDPRSVDAGAPEPGVRPLTGWSDLRRFARDWSDAMADRRTMSHNPAFADGYCCWATAGEILAQVGISDAVSRRELARVADRAVAAWFRSSAHRRALLNGAYDQVGVGVTVDHARETVWIAVNFRERADGASPPGSAWYRPGTTGPATPAGGWACDSQVAPYGTRTWPLPDSTLTRRGGSDRVATALSLSRDVSSPRTVLVASADTPSDALAAAGLAGTTDAPLLLTGPGRLDDRVASRLRSWRPDEVVLLGGPSALAARVATQVERTLPRSRVHRLQGADRFATAAAIARTVDRRGGAQQRLVLALGTHPDPTRAWVDAVTVSGLAASHDLPLLLTGPDRLPATTRSALEALAPRRVVVPGGSTGVSDGVLDQVRRLLPDARVHRVAGAGRYETSRAVVSLDQAWRDGPTRRVHLVHGGDWPDALTAGPAAARRGAVLALVDGRGHGSRGADMQHVDRLSDTLQRLHVTLVGGTSVITSDRAADVRRELHCVA